ncbi:MAG: hypothetical protein IPM34_01195 [Saprospiraceae bacterium]|nr:hypothetical protein [Saprospiraceae bacterium]
MLTPDIFTPIMILATIITLRAQGDVLTTAVTSILVIQSLLVHNSHIFIFGFGILLFLVLSYLVRRHNKKFKILEKVQLSRLAILFGFSICLLLGVNYVIDKRVGLSDGGHVFLLNKLHDDNLLVPFLNEKCPEKKYYLCNDKDTLPWDLIWDVKSPVTANGDWNTHKDENLSIIIDLLTSPKYFLLFIYKCVVHTIKQLVNFESGDAPNSEHMIRPPLIAIEKYYNFELKEFLAANQVQKKQDFTVLNLLQFFCIIISGIGLILRVTRSNTDVRLLFYFIFIISFLISNAFICANLSIVLDRYSSRLIWLIPLLWFAFEIPILVDKMNRELSVK